MHTKADSMAGGTKGQRILDFLQHYANLLEKNVKRLCSCSFKIIRSVNLGREVVDLIEQRGICIAKLLVKNGKEENRIIYDRFKPKAPLA